MALGAALLGLAVAGCFTNPINRAPVVTSINAVGNVLHGQPASFTAVASDPDGDPFQLTWTVETGECRSTLDPTNLPAAMPTPQETFVVPATYTTSVFCVWAFATDKYGAVGVRPQREDPTNRAPTARINVVLPSPIAGQAMTYSRYSDFVLSGALSSDPDGDQIHFSTNSWNVTSQGSPVSAMPCADPSYADNPSYFCFHADHEGTYLVALTVDDGTSGANPKSDPASITLTVLPDQLPCIAVTDPMFGQPLPSRPDPTMTRYFTVKQIDDDGDPLPPRDPNASSMDYFSWTYGPLDNPTLYNGPSRAFLPIFGGVFQTGDQIRVRVEISDRDPAQVIPAVLAGCGDKAFCAGDPTRPTCFQRVSWDLDFL